VLNPLFSCDIFSPFNNLNDWRTYATSIGATTSFNTFQNDEIWWGDEKLGFKGTNNTSVPFKLAFNTLLNKKLIKHY
jgi:hypothetical protein